MEDISLVLISVSRGEWFCQAYKGESLWADSDKLGFPLDADAYGLDDQEQLEQALRAEFPRARIEFLA
ncbi:MAG: hypothetical protein U0840_25750 [Gemmataceae bacterium]